MEQFAAKNTRILGVSFDTQKSNANFHRLFGLNFPLLCDTDRAMGLAYGAAKRPGTGGAARRIGIIINAQGSIHLYDRSASALGFPKAALKSVQDLG